VPTQGQTTGGKRRSLECLERDLASIPITTGSSSQSKLSKHVDRAGPIVPSLPRVCVKSFDSRFHLFHRGRKTIGASRYCNTTIGLLFAPALPVQPLVGASLRFLPLLHIPRRRYHLSPSHFATSAGRTISSVSHNLLRRIQQARLFGWTSKSASFGYIRNSS